MTDLKRMSKNVALLPGVTAKHIIDQDNSDLSYIQMKVLQMDRGSEYHEILTDWEICIVVLTGKVTISDGKQTFKTIGTRQTVFDRIPTDSVYISSQQAVQVVAESQAKVMLCYAPSTKVLPTKLISHEEVGVEHRGKNSNQRMVHNILTDDSPIANSLLVVEVYTDSGNWSSYPPHKHDQDNLPYESLLEEVYYHEMNPEQGFVFQRVYTDDRSLDETMTVENGQVVLVPKGYHPVAVPEGYDSYYLNIMAGPKKIWQFHNEPAHEWLLTDKE